MGVGGVGVGDVGVAIDQSHAASASWQIPGGSSLALRQDAPTLLVALGEGRKPLVFTFHDPKQTVGLLAAPHQPSVEAHPFRTPQGRSLHIVGTFDDGNPRLFEHAIPATVLERREQDSVRLQIDDAFHIGIHRLAAVGNGVFGLCQPEASLHVGDEHIFRVGQCDFLSLPRWRRGLRSASTTAENEDEKRIKKHFSIHYRSILRRKGTKNRSNLCRVKEKM